MSDTIKQYAVVEFDETINGKKIVELVPASWLTLNDTFCYWPPKNLIPKFKELVKIPADVDETWDTYPIEIITKAKDYEQGSRRLQKSFKRRNVDSSDNEPQSSQDSQVVMMKTSAVTRALANQRPLIDNNRSLTEISEESLTEESTNDNVITNSSDSTFRKDCTSKFLATNRQDIVDFNGLANYLEGVIQKEFKKMRQSLELSMTDKFKQLMKTIQYSSDPPEKQKAWQDLGNDLPLDSIEKFLTLEESLTKDEQKKKSLIDIFQMITSGSTDCETDVQNIMTKLIRKSVQLQYSGCGKKIKGVGKRSFKDTESFKILENFLLAKYHESKNKLQIISWVSRFLSGAKDREGGRAHRENKNN